MDFVEHVVHHQPHDEAMLKPADLLEGLLRVSQTVRMRLNEWLGQFDLNEGRFAVLMALSRATDGGCSQADLAQQLGQSESNISALIERMERDGLVLRRRSQADRRKRVLSISPAGVATVTTVEAKRFAWAQRTIGVISAEDQQSLITTLRKLGTSLDLSASMIPDAPNFPRAAAEALPAAADENRGNPSDDPRSPQFALRQMLLTLSSFTGVDASDEKDAA